MTRRTRTRSASPSAPRGVADGLTNAPEACETTEMSFRRRLFLGLTCLGLLTACPHPPRTVVINGQEVPYEVAAKDAFSHAEDSYNKKDWKTALERYEAFQRDFAKSTLMPDQTPCAPGFNVMTSPSTLSSRVTGFH